MSDSKHEWISAYLDDELTPAQRARGSRDLSRQPEARRRLGRYQLIGDAMRGNLPDPLEMGLAARVHQQIIRESPAPPRHPTLQEVWHWIRHPAPLAVGTGMLATLVAAGLWLYAQGPQGLLREAPTDQIAEAPGPDADAKAHRQLLGYLAAHAEVEPHALMPYVHLVDYEH